MLAGGATCVCEPGYSGVACDQCAEGYVTTTDHFGTYCRNRLPVTDGRIAGRYDAAAAPTVHLFAGSDRVERWYDRTQAKAMNAAGDLTQHHAHYRLVPRPGVAFDGNDTLVALHSIIGT